MHYKIQWPDGKDFAFTVFDDADLQTLENGKEVYSLLSDLGFRTTKGVWPLQGSDTPNVGGDTCENPDYLRWVLNLQDSGFEIALHNVAYHSSTRDMIIQGIEKFRELFNHYPYSNSNHFDCLENIYWGNNRLSGINKAIYKILSYAKKNYPSLGHVEDSPYFWGDICKNKIKYVRNFVFADINVQKSCPFLPYYDPDRPYVNYWFSSSEGPNVESFNRCLAENNQDRLVSEGGVCIMYTHFSYGFFENGQLNSRFRTLMERIGKMNGWFVPVRTLLDYILKIRGHHEITAREKNKLERRWLAHKILNTRGSS